VSWQQVRCDGCKHRCRYRDLKVFKKDGFVQTQQELWVASDDSRAWHYKSRGKVLGIMFATKQALWDQLLDVCPNYGAGDEPLEPRAIPFPKDAKAAEQRRYRARLPPGEHARRQREYRRKRREEQTEEA
jgi:hypothetical protein